MNIKHARASWGSAVVAVAGLAILSGCNPNDPLSNGEFDMGRAQLIRTKLEAGGGAGGGPSVAQGDPQGWATLRGTFRLSGSAPAMPTLGMGPNPPAICGRPKSERLVVGPNNGIRDVIIYLNDNIPDDSAEAEPKWTSSIYNLAANAGRPAAELPFAAQPVVEFDQKECRFLSHLFALRVGQQLKILNSDPIGHNTRLQPQNNTGFDKTIPAGGSDVYSPTAEETTPFPVACAIHPWMSANMMIRENPYFAVTKEDGSFEIKDVPAGVELEFRVWQEMANNVEQVEVNGEGTTWSKGKFTLTLNDKEEHTLDVMVNVSQFTK